MMRAKNSSPKLPATSVPRSDRLLTTRHRLRWLAGEAAAGRIDLEAAAAHALEREDFDSTAELRLAGALLECPPDTTGIALLLPRVTSLGLFYALIDCARGDRVTLLLDLIEQQGMSYDRCAYAVFMAVELMRGQPLPPRLIRLVHHYLRRRMTAEAILSLLAAVQASGDPQLKRSAKALYPSYSQNAIEFMRMGLAACLKSSLLLYFPEQAPPRGLRDSKLLARMMPGVERDAPCSCGSGKKYRKCCEADDCAVAVAHLELAKLRDPALLQQPPDRRYADEILWHMLPQELDRLDLASLPPIQLGHAIDRFIEIHRNDRAEQALAILLARHEAQDPIIADRCRRRLIEQALYEDELDLMARHVRLLRQPEQAPAQFRMAADILRPDPGPNSGQDRSSLYRLEQYAKEALQAPDGAPLFALVEALIWHLPALGVLLARSSLDPKYHDASDRALGLIDLTRTQLGLPPLDPWIYHYRRLRDLANAPAEAAGAPAAPSMEQVRHLEKQVHDLKERLCIRETHVAFLLEALEAKIPVLVEDMGPPPPAAAEPPTEDAELRRLRAKVAEFKAIISEGNEERLRLRRQLEEMQRTAQATGEPESLKYAKQPPGAAGDGEEGESPETEPGDDAEAPRGLLVPVWHRTAQESLRELPRSVAREALVTVAELGAGDATAWRQTKRMLRTGMTLFTTRVGLHYRLLFRLQESQLEVATVIHRKELEATIRHLGRG